MLSVRNLAGIEEPFIDFQGLKRKRKVNGEKTISLTILNSKSNAHAFHLIEEESIISFDGDEYVIKMMSEKALGKTTIKQVEAIHKFYVDLINKQQPNIHNGSITFQNYMEMVFENTGYSFIIIDPFYARSFENLGDDNRLSMLQKGLDRFKAEMELVGNQVRFKQQVGEASDFQFRYGHNIKTIERKVDTKNLATVIRGKGDPELGIEEYYRSSNADIFGELDAPSVSDERFKSNESLLEEMIARLQDTPEFSITIDFIELRAAGYPYTIPNEGDSVFVIYEPMQDLMIDTRMLEIVEDFDINLKPIKTNVTLANYKKSFAGTLFDNVQKQLDGFLDDDGGIKYNALDEAVRIATEALQSAQTELIFDNGIVAREKQDPNQLVVYNSKGLGISSDGGQTFREAITSDGFVLSAGAIGRLSANHIEIGPDTEFLPGYDPVAIKAEVDDDLSDILDDLDGLDEYIETAFKDGIIEESEAQAIEKYINSLNAEKADIDAQYSSIYTNGHLEGSAKTNLLNAKVSYNGAHNELINAINAAIADGKTTPTEKENVDNHFTSYRNSIASLSTRFEEALDSIAQSKADGAESNAKEHADGLDTTVRENLNLLAPLPTSIRMNASGITAATSDPNRYARLDYRGLYVRGGAIQIDGGLPDDQIENSGKWNGQGTYINSNGIYTGAVTANQVSVGWNNISSRVKISSTGLETYSGLQRTSLLDHRGQRFYREEIHVGNIGTSSWVDRTTYRGLTFQMAEGASYMAWSHIETPGSATVQLVWHKDGTVGTKGFSFQDDVAFWHRVVAREGITFGYGDISVIPYNNAVRWSYNSNNYIRQFDSGTVEFVQNGDVVHAFYASGTKSGGSIEIDNKRLGMSPIDSPQILIEYLEFDVELSLFGTKIMVDEKYLKSVSNFTAFSNNGELVEKGKDYVVIRGEGFADIRFVGKRVSYEDAFWADMQVQERREGAKDASITKQRIALDGETGEMYRLGSR